MTMFHAWQRVRVAHLPRVIAMAYPELVNAEGVVRDPETTNLAGSPGRVGVDLDGMACEFGHGWCFRPEWLEPITFPGAPVDIVAAELDKHRRREVSV